MAEELFNASNVSILTKAKTPEEAAQIFLGEVSRGLARVIADKLDQAITMAAQGTKTASAIDGWHTLVKGCAMQLDWERPKIGLPVGQITSFAARKTDGVEAMGVDVSLGISIKGTF